MPPRSPPGLRSSRSASSRSSTSANDPFPTAVDLDRAANTLSIAWDDGALTTYHGERLRWACPCAGCRGEGGIPGRLDTADELPEEDLHLENVALVGQYALQIGFASGHGTGIYTFPYLRELVSS